ncbi:60S ribosomal protein L4-1 [Platanthera guangdongensis]|uniref:60S ribosomal protein L4-1 n=1 Tax=Platanthera guangdongensis TaxID=2320717 RepID=A0ABR2MLS6_9ASPA
MSTDGGSTVPLPDVLRAAVRPDIVRFVHANLSRNKRQPYVISKHAGHQTFAESWGTGRIVSRIPCIPDGGTHRAGQGGHLRRLIVWIKSAFEKLDKVSDTFETLSELKKGYVLPRPKMINADLCRIINSDEVQSVERLINKDVRRKVLQKNPWKNLDAMLKLNPYAKTAKRMAC